MKNLKTLQACSATFSSVINTSYTECRRLWRT